MSLQRRALAGTAAAMMLAPTVLAASGCGAGPQACAGQCRPPYQLQVVFRTGTSKQVAAAAISKCADISIVIRVGQLRPRATAQWTTVIFTTAMPVPASHDPLLACLHRSPSVMEAGWPD